ncbi:MAG: hypothetical protein ACRD3C_14395 [Vicinamibacterales bacterium]
MIEAERLHVTYLLAADHLEASLLKARLHDLACDQLAQALGAAFEPYVKANDPSVWLVRRLDVDIGLDAAQSNDEVVGGWARQLSQSLSSKLDPEDADVVRFDDRASYLARYVVERAAGTADTKWYFRMSRGLRMLPASAAIRTALTDDPADGRRALRLLASGDLMRVASTLSEADAGRVLEVVAASGAGDAGRERLIDAWEASSAATIGNASGAALTAFVALARAGDGGPDAARTLLALAGFVRRARELAQSLREDLIASFAAADYASLVQREGVARAERLAPLLGWPADALRRVAAPAVSNQDLGVEWRHTPFGGVFLLLPRLAELPLPEEFGDLALLRLWLAVKCVGTERAFPFFCDPLVRELLGVDADLSADAFRKWQRRVPDVAFARLDAMLAEDEHRRGNSDDLQPGDLTYLDLPKALRASRARDRRVAAASQRVLRNLAWRLPGFSASSFRHLFDNFLDCPAKLRQDAHTRVVTLGRVPLSVVLNMTGAARDSFVCPWLDDLPFQLFPEG